MFRRFCASLLIFSLIFGNLAVVGNATASETENEVETVTETKTAIDNLVIVSEDDANDLYNTLIANYTGVQRYASLDEALENAVENQGIMILADIYPTATPVSVSDEQKAKIEEYNIRLYVEYAKNTDALGITGYGEGGDGLQGMGFNRAVVVNAEALNMDAYSLLYVHGARFRKKTDISNAWLVSAKVAGYDTADFELEDTEPYVLLEENADGNVLIASTKLSQFISGRYAPYGRWQTLWQSILSWVTRSEVAPMEWTPSMNPNYGPDEELADDAYSEAIRLNTEWYLNSGIMPNSDGTEGVYQCFGSGANFDIYGDQNINTYMRADCNGESAGNLALAGVVLNNEDYKNVAYNVMEWLLQSEMATGDRSDPESAQYGLLSWNTLESGLESYYGDDNAKAILGMILTASALEEDKWDQRILEAILANFRTAGVYGFRDNKLFGENLDAYGWEYYYDQETVVYASHYQSLLWGCYLWAYDKTGYEPLLERSKTAISMMMAAYEETMKKDVDDGTGEWTWTNGMQQERAKMILSLAWLARIEPTEEHIGWLNTMITDLMAHQDEATGALQEALGEEGEGVAKYGPFTSNDQYGKHEAPVIQANGDPCTDALYTSSFAMMTLNEAYSAMKEKGYSELAATYKNYLDTLSDYMVRIQQVSDNGKYDGVWTRGFDYEKWEVYGSDGDAGWGIWCTETGWTQAWISSTLSLMLLDTNIWDYTKSTTVNNYFAETAELMLSSNAETPTPTITIDATLKYSAGAGVLLDGVYGSTAWTDGCWNGAEGTDMEIVVDYKETKTFDGVTLGFNRNMNSGVCPPSAVTYYVSDDGVTYTEVGSITITTDVQSEYDNRGSSGEIVRPTALFGKTVSGRYLKAVVKNPGTYERTQGTTKTWVFMDELELYTIDTETFAPWENENSEAYCEACGEIVSGWVALEDNNTEILSSGNAAVGRIGDLTNGKHYHVYVSEDYTFEGNFGTITSGSKVCLHTNGKTLTYQGRLLARDASELNIMGNGTITTTGTHTLAEGTLVLGGTAKLHIYGGTITTSSTYGSPVLLSAGTGATITIEDGAVIDGNNTARCIKVTGTDQVIMNGGTVQNGFYSLSKPGIEPNNSFTLITGATTRNGGNVFLKTGATFTMNGGTIKDGVAGCDSSGANAMYAGNVFVYGGKFIMNGGSIENGGATSSVTGGNIYITSGGTFTLNDGTIKDGHRLSTDNTTKLTTAAGGNVYISSGSFTMNGGTVTSSNTALQGANFYLSGGTSAAAVLNIAGGTVSGGKATNGGSIFMTTSTSYNAELHISGGTVSGGSATGNGGNIYMTGAGTNVLLDFSKGSIETGIATGLGGNIYAAASRLSLSGSAEILDGVAGSGGNIYANSNSAATKFSTVTVADSVLIDNGTANTQGGGNIYLAGSGSTLTVSGGTISDGEATIANGNASGGNIRIASGVFTMTGGTVQNGYCSASTTGGGNLYITGGNTGHVISGGSWIGGTADGCGGNIYVYNGGLTINGTAQIDGGTAVYKTYTNTSGTQVTTGGMGGAIYKFATAGNATAQFITIGGNAVVKNGVADKYAGNIYVSGVLTIQDNAQILNGTVNGGPGGNVYLTKATAGVLKMTGGTISGGTGTSSNNVYVGNNCVMDMSGGTIYGTDGSTQNGSALRVCYQLYLSGDASILRSDGVKQHCFLLQNGAQMFIDKGWTGTASVSTNWTFAAGEVIGDLIYEDTENSANNITGNPILWGTCASALSSGTWSFTFANGTTADTPYTGSLIQESSPYWGIIAADEGKVMVAVAGYVDENGKTIWAASNDAVLSEYDFAADRYVILTGEVTLTDELSELTVMPVDDGLVLSGTGKVYGIDPSNDDYKTCKTVTIADGASITYANETVDPATGNRYIAIMENGSQLSFHRLNMRLSAVSLRANAECGIYYKALYECDDTLAGEIDSYGVVFSVNNMPGADFKTESGDRNLYTAYDKESFKSGESVTSGAIFGIMKEGLTNNAQRGKMDIYANAYIVINGQTLVADGAAYSLFTVMQAINNNWQKYVDAGKDGAIKAFYELWKDEGMSAWAEDLPNIAG